MFDARPYARPAALLMLATLFALAVASAQPVWAQTAAAAPQQTVEASPAELEKLIGTLEDEGARKELLEQLKTLLAAQQAATGNAETEAPASITDSVIATLNTALSTLAAQLTQLGNAFADLPKLAGWLQGELTLSSAQQGGVLLHTIGMLILVLGAGLAGDMIIRLLTRRLRQRLALAERHSIIGKLLGLLNQLVLEALMIAGFAAGCFGIMSVLTPDSRSQIIVLAIVNATLLNRIVMAVVRTVTAYRLHELRLLPVSDETAGYLYIWARRLSSVAIYGYFLGQIALFSGLPVGAYAAFIKLVGMTIAAMVIIIILQNRQNVEQWIRTPSPHHKPEADPNQGTLPGMDGAATEGTEAATVPAEELLTEPTSVRASAGNLRVLRYWLADLWHILAILYTIAIFMTWALEVPGGFGFMASATLQTALLIAVGAALTRLARHLINRGFAIPKDISEALPGLERRANRYLPVLRGAASTVIWAAIVLGILHGWGVDSFAWLLTPGGRSLLGGAVTIACVAAFSVVVWELVSSAIERKLRKLELDTADLERAARLRTLLPLTRTVFTVALLTIAGLVALSELGVNIAPLLAGAGILGVAIGFGSQKLVQDIITGLFILIEDQVSVGDVIDTGSHSGSVEKINLRTIRLRDLSGTVHVIPYSEVTTMKNMTREFAFAVMDIGVAYREDVDEVIALIERVGAELQQDETQGPNILEPITIFGLDQFADSAVIIKCRLKTRPMTQWGVKRAFNRLLKKRFDEHGIEIPFPHQTIYFGELKDGSSPPANIKLLQPKSAAKSGAAGDSVVPVSEDEKAAAVDNLSTERTDDDH
jgi:moderate conductance mechanosensitive channel